MPSYKVVVLLNVLDGREDEFNRWFTDVHLADSLKIPGYVSGQRFRLAEHQREDAPRTWTYLTLYDVETDDLPGVIAQIKARLGTPLMPATDTIAPGGFLHFFEPITELMSAK